MATKPARRGMKAYVLIETAPGKTKSVKKELSRIAGHGTRPGAPRRRHRPLRLHRAGRGRHAGRHRPARHRRDRRDRRRHPHHHLRRHRDRLRCASSSPAAPSSSACTCCRRCGATATRSSCSTGGGTPAACPPACARSWPTAPTTPPCGKALAGERVDALVDVTYAPTTGADVDALLDALAGRVGHVLFVSTGRVYDHARPIPFDEDTPRTLYWGEYAKNKIAGEDALLRRHREAGLPVTIVRPTHVYGPLNTRNNETFFFDRLVRGRPILLPDAGGWLRQFGHVEDLADAMAAMLGAPAAFGRSYNVSGEEAITQAGLRRADRGGDQASAHARGRSHAGGRQAGAVRPEPRLRLPRRLHDDARARRAGPPAPLLAGRRPGPDLRVVSARGPGSPPDRLRGRGRAARSLGADRRPCMRGARRPTPIVLVYNPDEAAAYAKTIRPPRGRSVTIHTAATEAEAAAVIGEVDIVYGWKFPASLYARAPAAGVAAGHGRRGRLGRSCPSCRRASSSRARPASSARG